MVTWGCMNSELSLSMGYVSYLNFKDIYKEAS